MEKINVDDSVIETISNNVVSDLLKDASNHVAEANNILGKDFSQKYENTKINAAIRKINGFSTMIGDCGVQIKYVDQDLFKILQKYNNLDGRVIGFGDNTIYDSHDPYMRDYTFNEDEAIDVTDKYQDFVDAYLSNMDKLGTSKGVDVKVYLYNGTLYVKTSRKYNGNIAGEVLLASAPYLEGQAENVIVTYENENFHYDINSSEKSKQTLKFSLLVFDEEKNPIVFTAGNNLIVTDSKEEKRDGIAGFFDVNGVVLPDKPIIMHYEDTSATMTFHHQKHVNGGMDLKALTRISISCGTHGSKGRDYGTFNLQDNKFSSQASDNDYSLDDHTWPHALAVNGYTAEDITKEGGYLGPKMKQDRNKEGGGLLPAWNDSTTKVVGSIEDIGGSGCGFPVTLKADVLAKNPKEGTNKLLGKHAEQNFQITTIGVYEYEDKNYLKDGVKCVVGGSEQIFKKPAAVE